MDRVLEHLSLVSLPTLAVGLFCAVVALCLIPRQHRLEVSLALMSFTLTLSSLIDIGLAANIAKVSAGFVFLLVGALAVCHPGKRRRLSIFCWGYVLLGLLAMYYVKDTTDVSFAMVLRIQWVLLTLAAIPVAGTIVDETSLQSVLRGIFIGLCLGCSLTLLALIEDPWAAFRSGFGRYMPYGCNPNQIGITYAITAGLGFYFSFTCKSPLAKGICVVLAAIAVGQSVLTVSRGSFMVLSIMSLPSLFLSFRRPIFAVFSVVLMVGMFGYLIRVAEDAAFDRLDRGLISRTDTTLEVLDEVRLRPWFGLGFTHDLVAYDTDLNAHNAYVAMLYLGGLSLALPQLAIQFWGQWRIFKSWTKRWSMPLNPLSISLLFCLSYALFLQGMVNDMAYYPTYTWAFLNVFVGCVSISLGRAAKRSSLPARQVRSFARTRTFAPRPLETLT